MNPDLLFLNAVPDDMRVFCVYSQAARGPSYVFPGAASFLTDAVRAIPSSQVALLGPGFDVRLHEGRLPRGLVNHIGDYDSCAEGLRLAEALRARSRLPCFNLPKNVARATRDGVSRMLSDVDGVLMPRTLRLQPTSPQEILASAATAGLSFPLIMRIAGDHGGRSMVRIESADDLAPIHSLPWGGRTVYLTEFVDYASADGHYRKMRLVVVGDAYFVRHRVRGDHWKIHVGDRDAESTAEEAAFLADFDASMRPVLDPVIARIRERMGLDYFGIDCSLMPDGRLLVFEANVCMKILHNSMPSPNMWDAPIARIEHALLERLGRPEQWISQRG